MAKSKKRVVKPISWDEEEMLALAAEGAALGHKFGPYVKYLVRTHQARQGKGKKK